MTKEIITGSIITLIPIMNKHKHVRLTRKKIVTIMSIRIIQN